MRSWRIAVCAVGMAWSIGAWAAGDATPTGEASKPPAPAVGPKKVTSEKPAGPRPWVQMDYGPAQALTVESPVPEPTVAQKGVLVRLDKAGGAYAVFDEDLLRYAAVGFGGAQGPVDWKGVLYDGGHRVWTGLAGEVVAGTRLTPGWADPATGKFEDPRVRFASVDYKPQPEAWRNRAYGPLPRAWGRYRGMYMSGERVVFSYEVGGVGVLDSPGYETRDGVKVFTRTLNVAAGERPMSLLVAEAADQVARVVKAEELGAAGGASGAAEGSAVRVGAKGEVIATVVGAPKGSTWEVAEGGQVRLVVPARAEAVRLKVLTAKAAGDTEAAKTVAALRGSPAVEDLAALTRGGPGRWPQTIYTKGRVDDPALVARPGKKTAAGATGAKPPVAAPKSDAPKAPAAAAGAPSAAYVGDTLVLPVDNPWHARVRPSGIDFFADGRAAVCTWDGDVWVVSGIDGGLEKLAWRRIATGLHQPLGLRVIRVKAGDLPAGVGAKPQAAEAAQGREVIYVSCRDQIARLHDLDGDGEIDFYECFNSDHQVTEHFHEFAMGLDTDSAGNLYYAKGARHALPQVIAQHGTVIRVSADGSRSEIVATGMRAANGIGVAPDGRVAVSDQEGFWMPANRINVFRPGPTADASTGVPTSPGAPLPFFGNIWGYTSPARKADQGYDSPLCWMPPPLDRSPAEEFWVRSEKWGPLAGRMLHTSYGMGRLFLVLDEEVGGVPQGGVVPLGDLAFPTGVMRGRFNPVDGQLYLCGLVGWSSNTADPGGLFRVRYTGRPLHQPTGLKVVKEGLEIEFGVPVDPKTAGDTGSYAVQQWNYRWTQNYGSKNYRPSDPAKQGEDDVEVTAATVSPDGRRVTLKLESVAPVMQMKIDMYVRAADGTEIRSTIHNTINRVPKG